MPALLATITVDHASGDERMEFAFTRAAPGASTGVYALAVIDPPAEPLAKLTLHLPRGARFDTTVPRQCRITPKQLEQADNGVCRKALIGTGRATVGLAPVIESVALVARAYNAPDALLVRFERTDGTGNPRVIKGSVKRNRITLPVSDLTFLPGVQPTLTRVYLNLRSTEDEGPYLEPPPTCDGEWTAGARFTYADGSQRYVSSAAQPCRRPLALTRPATRRS
jgi:hypothetical protein